MKWIDQKIEDAKVAGHDVKCGTCGEMTTRVRESSMWGYVHRWGPTSHPFEPVVLVEVREENAGKAEEALQRARGIDIPGNIEGSE